MKLKISTVIEVVVQKLTKGIVEAAILVTPITLGGSNREIIY